MSAARELFDQAGVLLRAHQLPSSHQDERPAGSDICLLVIHNISLPPAEFGGPQVPDFFLGRLDHSAHPYFDHLRGIRVSSHFFIRRGGELIQFVPCERRAWHAGQSQWRGRTRCNDFSIGIELEGTDDSGFTDAQYAELARLTRELQTRYPIEDIAGHSDIAPGRKTDPGLLFDWERYRALVARNE